MTEELYLGPGETHGQKHSLSLILLCDAELDS